MLPLQREGAPATHDDDYDADIGDTHDHDDASAARELRREGDQVDDERRELEHGDGELENADDVLGQQRAPPSQRRRRPRLLPPLRLPLPAPIQSTRTPPSPPDAPPLAPCPGGFSNGLS